MKNAKEALVNGAENLEVAGLEKSGIAGTEKEGEEEKKEDEKMETDDKEIKKEDEEKKETDAEKEKEATKDTEEKEKNEEKEKEKEVDKEKKPETAVDRLVKVFDGQKRGERGMGPVNIEIIAGKDIYKNDIIFLTNSCFCFYDATCLQSACYSSQAVLQVVQVAHCTALCVHLTHVYRKIRPGPGPTMLHCKYFKHISLQ